MPFEFKKMEIPEVILIEQKIFKDARGFFKETYKSSDFKNSLVLGNFVQDSFSTSQKNTLRGLHYQKDPKAQGKYVYCLKGCIFDVAVDLRKKSPTYGRWVGTELSADNHRALYIPEGFAHGFAVLSDDAYVAYKLTQEYVPDLDRGVLWNDPTINVRWPVKDPLLSEKDKKNPLLENADNNFVYPSVDVNQSQRL